MHTNLRWQINFLINLNSGRTTVDICYVVRSDLVITNELIAY